MRARRRHRPGVSPLTLAAVVVLGLLAFQAGSAALLAARAADDAENAALEIARVIGDATASQVRITARPVQDEGARLLQLTAAEGIVPADPRAVDVLIAELLSHPQVGALALDDGETWLHVERVREGFRASEFSDGRVAVLAFDAEGKPAASPPAGARPMTITPWRDIDAVRGVATWGEPLSWGEPERPVVYASTAGDAGMIAGVRLDADTFDRILADTAGAQAGEAFIVSANGAILSLPDARRDEADGYAIGAYALPTLADLGLALPSETLAIGDGQAAVEGETIDYLRPVDPSGSPSWQVLVRVSIPDAVPAVGALGGTLRVFAAVVVASVMIGVGVLIALRGPLSSLASRARTDALTGLANRHEFDSRGRAMVDAAVRRDERVVVIAMDMDNFKSVNDTLGHDAGDEVLQQVAIALQAACDPRDVVARFGGDEFAVVHWYDPAEHPDDVVERLRVAVEAGVTRAPIGVSAGYAVLGPHLRRLAALHHAADAALVAGRRTGKGATYAAPRA